jgi:hypothetical protein
LLKKAQVKSAEANLPPRLGERRPAALAGKMANSIDAHTDLQQTHNPNPTAVVRLADEARTRGRALMRNAATNAKGAQT